MHKIQIENWVRDLWRGVILSLEPRSPGEALPCSDPCLQPCWPLEGRNSTSSSHCVRCGPSRTVTVTSVLSQWTVVEWASPWLKLCRYTQESWSSSSACPPDLGASCLSPIPAPALGAPCTHGRLARPLIIHPIVPLFVLLNLPGGITPSLEQSYKTSYVPNICWGVDL